MELNPTLKEKAISIKAEFTKGNLLPGAYFAKLASLGKKYNVSVWEIQKHI